MTHPGALAFALSFAVSLSGCASFDGRGLVPGKSVESEVVALMGEPSHRVGRPAGEATLLYSRLPEGRAVYAVEIGRDGVMQSIEQRLVRANLRRIVAGTSTMKDIRDLFGPPGKAGRMERQARTWWEYKYVDYDIRRVFWVQFSDDGIAREVLDSTDWERDDLCTPPAA